MCISQNETIYGQTIGIYMKIDLKLDTFDKGDTK